MIGPFPHGRTIPHEVGAVQLDHGSAAAGEPGNGRGRGGTVRAVLEMAGVTDCLTKLHGSSNKLNAVRAVFDGLDSLRTREQIAELRGVETRHQRHRGAGQARAAVHARRDG